MVNLKEETLTVLKEHDLSPDNIIYIGTNPHNPSPHYSCSWDSFTVMADASYHSGYGGQEVAHDLVIIFKDGTWMERGEYDGSEWWNVHPPFVLPTETLPITGLFAEVGWDSLEAISKRAT